MRIETLNASAVRLFGRLGVHLTRRTRFAAVSELINELLPIDGGVELIRLGPAGDGGYLIPNDLQGIEYAFSPGVSNESGFEAALADQGIKVFLADYSVSGPASDHPQFEFDRRFVGCLSDDRYITLDDWKDGHIPDYRGDLLLQMDIEGAEFETLFAASHKLLEQFRIMVIEFHNLQNFWNRPYFDLVSRVFRKLLRTHSIVHIHPNNCCGSVESRGLEIPRIAEFTFYRHDRLRNHAYRRVFPHPLDRDNTSKPPLPLPERWYQLKQ